ncbi:hypothetical protein M409DRAFT_29676 [Zasmidium cellare ATCC 36951]|uniref:Uncharacterized protein n=1 Tax=Zasmidium cellare ATCC 36951 TaxID=1080233 RepID=A0A6A6C3A4_ZASCE|nr:uncharacterized protein M409DRAFT_29676 [Zasmidium cellare ATCC 36951]KAF2159866.1 hypothetical protein M409DRAFT_29676 [Zasmidium cellare ATCC 36951]
MDGNPLSWTVSQVADFFRHHAARYLSDRPNLRLPDLDIFVQSLEENDIDGDLLLKSVDNAVLRDELEVPTFRARSAIIHCIAKLREASDSPPHAATVVGSEPTPQTPNSINGLSHPNASDPEPPPALTPGENVRVGEVEVQDGRGKKRRKLDLTALSTTQPTNSLATRQSGLQQVLPASGYLSDAKLTVDELFYGRTPVNAEIGDLPPQGHDVILEPNYEIVVEYGEDLESKIAEHTNAFLEFQHQEQNDGDSVYAYRQVRHFMTSSNSNPRMVSRRGKDDLAIVPYREELVTGNKTISATVIRLDDTAEEGAIAVRENNALLDDDVDPIRLEQESNEGEWDFLPKKWRQDDDEVLSELRQSDDGSDGMSSGLIREIEEEAAELDQLRRNTIGEKGAGEIVDDAIVKMVAEWKETLPKKEEKHAWRVWKKMKGSRTLRQQLIEASHDRIRILNKRLAKQKENILRTEWRKENEIREQCEAMRPSVMDREEERWQICVWGRRQEPHHVVRHGQHGAPKGNMDAGNHQRVIVHANDRISVSPPPIQEDDEDLVPERVHTLMDGDENGEDDPDDDMMYADDGHSFDGGDEMEDADSPMADVIEPSPPLVFGSPSQLPFDQPRGDSDATASPRNRIQDSPKDDTESESESLTDMATLLSQRPKREPPSQSRVAKESNSREQPIEISSDSHSTPASKNKQKKGGAGKGMSNGFPDLANGAQVESWDIEELVDDRDHRRLLIKLLFDAGSDKRQQISDSVRRMGTFNTELKKAISILQHAFKAAESENGSTTPIYCARLFLAYLFLAPETMQGQPPANVLPKAYMNDSQLNLFSPYLKSVLEKPLLFKHPKPEPISSAKSKASSGDGSRVISLLDSEDDEDDPLQDTPSKKKRKNVMLSEKGQQSQIQAFDRQDRFKELQQQSSSQQQLQAMIQNDPSRSHIQINILKGEDEDDIFVDKRIARDMKEHQVTGVQFMWRELTASGADDAQGCILAHEQGLGKTMQAIAVLIAVDEAAQSENPRINEQLPPHLRPEDMDGRQLRVLILVPAALIQNWRAELDKWAPNKFPNVWSIESVPSKNHLGILDEWHRIGGVMLMGHEMFQKKITRKEGKQVLLAAEGRMAEVLLDPGPDIVVVDEAHRMANPKSQRTIAVNQVRTESRLALTGTPMSNEVQEIYSIVSFVAPDYLGGSDWFSAQFALPIKEGNGKDSTAYQRRKAALKLNVLHKQIEPKVNRADITVLKGSLTAKVEFVITLPLTSVQQEAYTKYVQHLVGEGKTKDAAQVTLFGYLSVLTLLMNHPIAFKRKMLSPGHPKKKSRKSRAVSTSDSDSGDASPAQEQKDDNDDAGDSIRTSGFTEDVIAQIISHVEDRIDADLSTKTAMVMEIVRRCKEIGDKILIFSHSIPSLDYLGELFQMSGVDFVRIDGSMSNKARDDALKAMQSGKRDVMLMSTRAGGVGLNIQIANRVIILDSSFNPTHEKQAISRSYRLGQKKPVFVYRFSVGGTFEDFLYNKQMFKERLNKGVVDKISTKRIASINSKHAIREPTVVEQLPLEDSLGKDAVLDGIVSDYWEQAKESGEDNIIVRQLATMEVLQEEVVDVDVPLTEEDKRVAEEEQRMAEAEFQEGRNAVRGKRGGAAPNLGAMRPPNSTAPVQSRRQQSGNASGRPSVDNGINGLPTATQPGPSQPQSSIVRLPTGQPRPSAPAIHGLPLPPPQ